MASKKKVVKKTKTKVRAKSKPVKKTKKVSKPQSKKNLRDKIKSSTRSLMYSFIAFVISMVLFLSAEPKTSIEALFGFLMIIFGALTILYILVEVIFYFANRK